jgi:hypothetical protein
MKLFDKSLKKLHRTLKSTEREIQKLEIQNKMPKVAKQSKFRERLTSILGLITVVLAICGIVFGSLFFYHVRLHKQEKALEEKIDYYTVFIEPTVLFDTGEFVSTDNANNLSLLIPSFFKAQEMVYAGVEERESLTVEGSSTSLYIIREEQVQAAAKALFGKEIICQTFTLDGLTFEYVENEHYFLSPITLRLAMYSPHVVGCIPVEDGVELTVEYVEIAAAEQHNVAKTMKYTLKGEYRKEIITSIVSVVEE